MRYACICFMVMMVSQVFGQAPEYAMYKDKYPDSYRVVLNVDRTMTIDIDKGELVVELSSTEETLYLGETAKFGAKESVKYSSFYAVDKLEAATWVWENGKYRQYKVKEFKEKDELSGATFYDDTKSINFRYPKMDDGVKTVLHTKERIKNPRFLGAHFFADFAPITKNKYTLIVNEDIKMDLPIINGDGYDIKYSSTTKRGNIIHTWEVANVDKVKSEGGAPNYKGIIPHLLPRIKSFTYKDKKTDVLTDINSLYNWYYSLVKNVNQQDLDAELVQIVDSITAGMDNELDKVKAIYYWAQHHIKYVAFEYALGGFIPREANEVYKKKYGDCKDNSSILHEMMEIANIKGHLTWIGTRDIPYHYRDVPSPSADNHMILTYLHDTTAYFLDATGRYLPFGQPSSFIQGKEALVALDSTNFLIKQVPVMEANSNVLYDSTHFKIESDAISGSGKLVVSGYQKINFYNTLENQKSKDDLRDFYNYNLRKGSNKFLVDQFKEANKYHYDKDLEVDYSFNVSSYVHRTENEIFLNLNLNQDMGGFKLKKDRQNALEIDNKNVTKYVNVFDIPDDYEVHYLPENVKLEHELYSAEINYRVDDRQVIYETEVSFNFLVLETKEHVAFNKFIKTLGKSYKESLVLRKQQQTTDD